MGSDEFQYTAAEFVRSVQIVSRLPDQFCIQNRRFPRLSGVGGSQPGHNFLGNYRNLGVRWWLSSADLNSLGSNLWLRGGFTLKTQRAGP